jgi:hypothetical protein
MGYSSATERGDETYNTQEDKKPDGGIEKKWEREREYK